MEENGELQNECINSKSIPLSMYTFYVTSQSKYDKF